MRSRLVNAPRNTGTQWAEFGPDSFAAADESGIGRLPHANRLERCLLSGVTRKTCAHAEL